jgi:hypothetical protein
MDDGVRRGLGAWADSQDGDEFSDGITRGPDPEVVGLVAQGGGKFVRLEMTQSEVMEEVRMEPGHVYPRAGEPQANGDLSAERVGRCRRWTGPS